MPQHPALAKGRVAVITGAASRALALPPPSGSPISGMKVCMADLNVKALEAAVDGVSRRSGRQGDVIGVPTDVSKREQVEHLKDARL